MTYIHGVARSPSVVKGGRDGSRYAGLMAAIATQLRELRLAAGLTQDAIGIAVGKTRTMINKIEAGKATTTTVIERWAATCGREIAFIDPAAEEFAARLSAIPADRRPLLLQLAKDLPDASDSHVKTVLAVVNVVTNDVEEARRERERQNADAKRGATKRRERAGKIIVRK